MSLWMQCPKCGTVFLADAKCPKCGRGTGGLSVYADFRTCPVEPPRTSGAALTPRREKEKCNA